MLLISACSNAKVRSSGSDTSKLLLSQEILICNNCKLSNDTLKITSYNYDHRNRLIFMCVDNRMGKYLDSDRYYYDTDDNLVERRQFSDGKIDTTIFHYENNVPIYSIANGSKHHSYDYSVLNNKIVKITSAVNSSVAKFIYKKNNTIIFSFTRDKYRIIDTNKYGVKRNPLYGCNFKWPNLLPSLEFPENELIEKKTHSSMNETATISIDYYSYDYNDNGYPNKRMDQFYLNSHGGHGSIVYYKYISAN